MAEKSYHPRIVPLLTNVIVSQNVSKGGADFENESVSCAGTDVTTVTVAATLPDDHIHYPFNINPDARIFDKTLPRLTQGKRLTSTRASFNIHNYDEKSSGQRPRQKEGVAVLFNDDQRGSPQKRLYVQETGSEITSEHQHHIPVKTLQRMHDMYYAPVQQTYKNKDSRLKLKGKLQHVVSNNNKSFGNVSSSGKLDRYFCGIQSESGREIANHDKNAFAHPHHNKLASSNSAKGHFKIGTSQPISSNNSKNIPFSNNKYSTGAIGSQGSRDKVSQDGQRQLNYAPLSDQNEKQRKPRSSEPEATENNHEIHDQQLRRLDTTPIRSYSDQLTKNLAKPRLAESQNNNRNLSEASMNSTATEGSQFYYHRHFRRLPTLEEDSENTQSVFVIATANVEAGEDNHNENEKVGKKKKGGCFSCIASDSGSGSGKDELPAKQETSGAITTSERQELPRDPVERSKSTKPLPNNHSLKTTFPPATKAAAKDSSTSEENESSSDGSNSKNTEKGKKASVNANSSKMETSRSQQPNITVDKNLIVSSTGPPPPSGHAPENVAANTPKETTADKESSSNEESGTTGSEEQKKETAGSTPSIKKSLNGNPDEKKSKTKTASSCSSSDTTTSATCSSRIATGNATQATSAKGNKSKTSACSSSTSSSSCSESTKVVETCEEDGQISVGAVQPYPSRSATQLATSYHSLPRRLPSCRSIPRQYPSNRMMPMIQPTSCRSIQQQRNYSSCRSLPRQQNSCCSQQLRSCISLPTPASCYSLAKPKSCYSIPAPPVPPKRCLPPPTPSNHSEPPPIPSRHSEPPPTLSKNSIPPSPVASERSSTASTSTIESKPPVSRHSPPHPTPKLVSHHSIPPPVKSYNEPTRPPPPRPRPPPREVQREPALHYQSPPRMPPPPPPRRPLPPPSRPPPPPPRRRCNKPRTCMPMPIPMPIPYECPPQCPPPCPPQPCCSPRKKRVKKKKKKDDDKQWDMMSMYGMYTLFQQMFSSWQNQMSEQYERSRPKTPPPQYAVVMANPCQVAQMMGEYNNQGPVMMMPPCAYEGGGCEGFGAGEATTCQPNPLFGVTAMEGMKQELLKMKELKNRMMAEKQKLQAKFS